VQGFGELLRVVQVRLSGRLRQPGRMVGWMICWDEMVKLGMDIRAWCAFLRKSTQNKRVNFRMIHAQKRAGCMLDVLHWQMEFAKDFLKDIGDPWIRGLAT